GWFSLDYSGLTIPYLAPVQFYNAFDYNDGKKTCEGLVNGVPCTKDAECLNGPVKCKQIELTDYRLVNQSNFECKKDEECLTNTDSKGFCAVNVSGTDFNNCRCLNSVCIRPFNENGDFKTADGAGQAPECRGYPAKNAPFPSKNIAVPTYENANKFYAPDAKYSGEDFGCGYRKIEYGSGQLVKYFPWSAKYSVNPPDGFCQEKTDAAGNETTCTADTDCGADDFCLLKGDSKKKNKITEYRGWQGYCLEKDSSINKDNDPSQNPCLTWYPTYLLAGLQDLQNSYDLAGFSPAAYNFIGGGPYYCVDSARNEFRMTWFAQTQGDNGGPLPIVTLLKGAQKKDEISGKYFNNTNGPSVLEDAITDHIISKTDTAQGTCSITSNDTTDVMNAWTCEQQNAPKVSVGTPPVLVSTAAYPSPEWVCKVGDKNLPYSPLNLYDVNGDVWNVDGMFFQCRPNNSMGGKGWYYDPSFASVDVGIIDDLDVSGNGGFDTSWNCSQCTDSAFDGAQRYWNDNEFGNKSATNWEQEKTNCMAFYAAADAEGENKAFTNRIYQGKISGTDKCPFDNSKTLTKDIGCGLFGAINLTAQPDNNKDFETKTVKNVFLDGTTDEEKCGKQTIGTPTTYNFAPSEVWKGEGIYVGGERCLDEISLKKIFAKNYGYWEQKYDWSIANFNPTDNTPYTNKTGKNQDNIDIWGNDLSLTEGKDHPPIVAGVKETGKNDSSGKPVYAAAPYKITVGTDKGSFTEGNIEGTGGQIEVFVKFYA
ncbi:MAG: hypothetical protein HY980_02250, partial [Candidatus Magasanikbacteria bacterium]|nr:hypothetical protein [Candidatus Magasanikbacteria bacterium]